MTPIRDEASATEHQPDRGKVISRPMIELPEPGSLDRWRLAFGQLDGLAQILNRDLASADILVLS
jgi:hypothetical protein